MTKTAIVTGGATGIGEQICRTLKGAGYRVGVLDIDGAAADNIAETLEDGIALHADVTDADSVKAAYDTFGDPPDLVVNNAGVVRFGLLGEQEIDEIVAVMNINFMGVYYMAREAVNRMMPRGSGHIISLTSVNAYGPGPGSGAYPASKAAVKQLMRQFALEYGEHGIRANSVAPGFIDGGMSTSIYADPKVRAARSKGVPLGRLGTPEDIAQAVLFLDSDGGTYVNGHDLVVDGAVNHAVLKNLPRE
jgi:NAD(P)-dependent dehydrogenase (short-subunit alcohol dehydrogenase family)